MALNGGKLATNCKFGGFFCRYGVETKTVKGEWNVEKNEREEVGGFVSDCLHLGADADSELLSLRAIAGCGARAGASTWR